MAFPDMDVQADGDSEHKSNADVIGATPGPYPTQPNRMSNPDPGATDEHPQHPYLSMQFLDGAAKAWMDTTGFVPAVGFGA
jgi:hypothetical protein